jgi:hypothetical protein
MHMMKRAIQLLILFLLFSCGTNIDNTALIEHNFYTQQALNRIGLQDLKNLSRLYYQGKPDSLIRKYEEIIAMRIAAGFKLGGEISEIDFLQMHPYLDAAKAQSHLFWSQSEQLEFEKIIENTKIVLNATPDHIDLLELAVAVNTIDRLLLSAIRYSFSDGHELLNN